MSEPIALSEGQRDVVDSVVKQWEVDWSLIVAALHERTGLSRTDALLYLCLMQIKVLYRQNAEWHACEHDEEALARRRELEEEALRHMRAHDAELRELRGDDDDWKAP